MADGSTGQHYPGGELPDIGALLSETMNEVTENIGPYIMAGLGLTILVFAIMMVFVFGIYLLLALLGVMGFVGLAALMAMLPSELAGLGVIGGIVVGSLMLCVLSVLMVGIMSSIMAPMSASLHRAIADQQRGEQQLSFTSAFSSLGRNVGSVVGGTMLMTILSVCLAMLCYLPALLPMVLLGFAMPLIMHHDRSIGEGFSLAYQHAQQHLGWHAKFALLSFLLLFVANNIPLIGPMFYIAFQVRAYRMIFGDNAEPNLS